MERRTQIIFIRLCCLYWLAVVPWPSIAATAPSAEPKQQRLPEKGPGVSQVIRAPEWKGGVQVSRGECAAADGEFSFWVYSKAGQCGVPREEADRVVLFRLPTLGVAPLTVTARVPGGRYAVWAYGAGDPGHPFIQLCARTCVTGEMPPEPGWVFAGRIRTRDRQLMFLRTWDQPQSTVLHVQVLVLSSSETPPDWIP